MRKLATVLLCATSSVIAGQVEFIQTNLASDVPGLAKFTDPDLVNAWGMSASAGSPVWIATNGTGLSVLYNGAGVKQGLIVSLPGVGPTGTVFSNVAGSFNGDTFLFDNEDGTVSGWRGALGTTAETLVLPDAANVYKGLTDATIGGNVYAYAANFRSGAVDVLKGNGGAPNLAGNFTDPGLPAGYAPFGIQNLGGIIYVTYAVQDAAKHDDVAGAGNGIVDAFDVQGNFLHRLVSPGGALNSPWGLALAPAGFGDVGGDLLVGNFGDGTISAYNPTSGTFVQTLQDSKGNTLAIDGLWGLRFGNGGNFGSPNTLFFTAGPNGESHGLFGELVQAPEPATWGVAGVSLLALVLRSRKRIAR
jgi:uncharacterized protein (TIGR03118 family)